MAETVRVTVYRAVRGDGCLDRLLVLPFSEKPGEKVGQAFPRGNEGKGTSLFVSRAERLGDLFGRMAEAARRRAPQVILLTGNTWVARRAFHFLRGDLLPHEGVRRPLASEGGGLSSLPPKEGEVVFLTGRQRPAGRALLLRRLPREHPSVLVIDASAPLGYGREELFSLLDTLVCKDPAAVEFLVDGTCRSYAYLGSLSPSDRFAPSAAEGGASGAEAEGRPFAELPELAEVHGELPLEAPLSQVLAEIFIQDEANGGDEVFVLWRADLAPEDVVEARAEEGKDRLVRYFRAMPPLLHECMPLSFAELLVWLAGEGGSPRDALVLTPPFPEPERNVRVDLLSERLADGQGVRPEECVIFPLVYGGADEYGWDPWRGETSPYTAVHAAGVRMGLEGVPEPVVLPLTFAHLEEYVLDPTGGADRAADLPTLRRGLRELVLALEREGGWKGDFPPVWEYLDLLSRSENLHAEFRALSAFLRGRALRVAAHPLRERCLDGTPVPRGILLELDLGSRAGLLSS
ncbi:hypothetical protein [Brockia lithotrophica]|uniref:Uncharacterized protein n=1 Tax=Brockia lithotrophica TaxID=933949 RepID=A0A660L5S8_9BACL|nr:hypothetical protein [Brockia lithotrophica]RKQ88695.1 hypothetical protein C7438_0336 [Brockia lithotrophica]